MATIQDYLIKIKQPNPKTAVRIELLRDDETVKEEITNDIFNIEGSINVTRQDGARRTCSIVIDNSKDLLPINYNAYWIGTKFKVWMGIWINDNESYMFPQGVYYITNPSEVYNPSSKTITLQGVDKWAMLDGTLGGVLSKTWKVMFDQDIPSLVSNMLAFSRFQTIESQSSPAPYIGDRIDCKEPKFSQYFNGRENTSSVVYLPDYGEMIYTNGNETNPTYYILTNRFDETDGFTEYRIVTKSDDGTWAIGIKPDPLPTNLQVLTETKSIFLTPYTFTKEAGSTMAEMLTEYATMMRSKVFYDANGYLTFEPMSLSLDNISDFDKEILWHFTVQEKEMTGLQFTYDFAKTFNDIIVIGNIANGLQAYARLQNLDPASPTSVDKIGIKTRAPYVDTKYASSQQCAELGGYYAQTEMVMGKSGSISCTPLYHLDVDKIVTIATFENDLEREQFLIESFSIPFNSANEMSVSVINMKYFTNWTVIDERDVV